MNNILMLEIAENLRNLADIIEKYTKVPHNCDVQDVLPVSETSTPKKEAPITLEQIRAVLAEKSQSGKQPQVKALIQKHGANKLTDIVPSGYAEILKEAEEL